MAIKLFKPRSARAGDELYQDFCDKKQKFPPCPPHPPCPPVPLIPYFGNSGCAAEYFDTVAETSGL
jgi:hypothetical protein